MGTANVGENEWGLMVDPLMLETTSEVYGRMRTHSSDP